MQNGTAREYIIDLVENAESISTQREVRRALRDALSALQDTAPASGDILAGRIDEPGVVGPDYGLEPSEVCVACGREHDSREHTRFVPRVSKAERNEAIGTVVALEAGVYDSDDLDRIVVERDRRRLQDSEIHVCGEHRTNDPCPNQ